ncbi:MAG: hypothetical protein WDN29_13150 [Methylovirgula sp.]
MYKWANIVIGLAALSGAAGIMESAASAHTIADPLLKTSANMLIVNAASVIAISAYASSRLLRWALFGAATLLAGSLLFCGELSTHVFLGAKVFGFGRTHRRHVDDCRLGDRCGKCLRQCRPSACQNLVACQGHQFAITLADARLELTQVGQFPKAPLLA